MMDLTLVENVKMALKNFMMEIILSVLIVKLLNVKMLWDATNAMKVQLFVQSVILLDISNDLELIEKLVFVMNIMILLIKSVFAQQHHLFYQGPIKPKWLP